MKLPGPVQTPIALSVVFCLLMCLPACEPGEEQRNVIFILADDLGVMDLSIQGSRYYETPNIDRIGYEGMQFTRGYASSRVCSPSRASIMTGKHTARHGITDWIGAKHGEEWRTLNRHDKLLPSSYTTALPTEDITLPEVLQAAGYHTFFAGKWHLGSDGSLPTDHGFDLNKGGWEKGSPAGGYYSPWENPFLPNEKPGENLSMRLARETVDFIEANKDQPFFAFLSFYAVHGPLQTSEEKWRKYRDKAEAAGIRESGFTMERVLPARRVQDNPVYAGLIESMDEAIGHLLNALDEMGLNDETLIVFTSDNGGVTSGDAYSTTNLPFRGGKGYHWEGGIREPYFLKVPWLSIKDKTNDYPATGADFYPTILDLLDIPVPGEQMIDGISLVPLLKDKSLPERPLYWHYPHYGNQGGEPSSVLMIGDWKLVHYWEDDHDELYHLGKDQAEQYDLAQSEATRTANMREELLGWLSETGAGIPQNDPFYDLQADHARDERIRSKLWPRLEKRRKELLSPGFQPNEDWWNSKLIKD